jgi:hypothetical protein
MSKEVTDIRQAIQALSGFGDLQYEGVVCKVSDIDLATFTCTCTPINGDAEFYDVLLNADADKGFTLIPANGSLVIIQQTSQANAYVTMVSKVDQVYLAGDANGGLVKVQDLTSKLNALENKVNSLIIACASQVVTLAPSGAFALAPFFTSVTPLIPTQQIEIENTKVKHGNG